MTQAVRADSVRNFTPEQDEAIDAAYAVLEAGKALRAVQRRQAELDHAAKMHDENVVQPAMQRYNTAQARWRRLSQAAAGVELERAS